MLRKDLFLSKKAYLIIFTCLISITGSAQGAFPWWYNWLLGRQMPPWLIHILEEPWLLAPTIAFCCFITIVLICFFSARARNARKQLEQLKKEHEELVKKSDLLHKENDRVKTAHLHQQMMISHLTTLLAHQRATRSQEQLPTPPPSFDEPQ